MTHTRRSDAALIVAALATMSLLFMLPGTGTYSLWSTSTPLMGTVTTGDLAIDHDVMPAGSWSHNGDPFSPAEDALEPGDALVYTVPGVSVTAVGENLRATFQDVTGADLPEFIDLTIGSTPATIHGADPADDPQRVDLALTLTAAVDLPEDGRTIDLTSLTATLGNGAGWTDTARLDAGTLTTSSEAPPPATDVTANLQFDPALDEDGEFGFHLQRPAADTYIDWGWDTTGNHYVVRARDGVNMKPADAAGVDVKILGVFEGIGSCSQDEELIGALTYVGDWKNSGTVDASCAFKNAVNLKSVTSLPDTLTTTASMFEGADKLQYIQLSGWDSSHVTDMSSMFRDSGLTSMSAQLDTSSVTDMSYMFADASEFTGPAKFSSAANVTTMKGMFQNASSYSGLVWGDAASGVDAPQVQDMSYMFDNAASFNGPLQNWDVPNVETMDGMLRGATAFTQDLSGWPVPHVTSWENFSDTLPQSKWPNFGGSSDARAVTGPEGAEADTPGTESRGEEAEEPTSGSASATTAPAPAEELRTDPARGTTPEETDDEP